MDEANVKVDFSDVIDALMRAFENGLECGKPKWISVSDKLPDEDCKCLVYKSAIAQGIITASFTHNLESIDEYDFSGEKRAGFFYYDSEYGYCEMLHITHWMPLPEPPKDGE